MKTTLTLLALMLGCSGCAVAPMVLSGAASKMDWNDVQNVVTKVQKAADGQRDLTEPEEIAIGAGIASNLLGAAPLLQDKKVQRYVTDVGMWLTLQTERADLPWHFAVLDDNEFNAFAAPGGYIFITRGLLLSMRNEAELAGVLAHEISHVLRKHHLAALKKANGTSVLADLGAAVLEKNPQLTQNGQLTPALAKIAGFGTELYMRGLDKDDEFEADRMAVVICARAGYDPYGLPAVLQSLQTVNPSYSGLALMVKTHPSFSARLDLLAQVMDAQFDKFETQPNLAARFKANVALPKVK
ncbi:MAG: M48 family metalloprotease [Pseudomonadota bacterium]